MKTPRTLVQAVSVCVAAAAGVFFTISTVSVAAQQSGQPNPPRQIAVQGSMVLPQTRLDSFVLEAQGHAPHIYGDEGVDGPPPYMGFNKPHRINTGIMDERDKGLTTGHGSWMPDAWGKDEFLGLEMDQSGYRGRHAADGFVDGLPNIRPEDGAPGEGASNPFGVPPSPGEGYQAMTQHGVLVGWWSPEEVALSQQGMEGYIAALESIINSSRYYGGEGGKMSIEMEIASYRRGHGG
jgi:hypothetical protein